MELTLNRLLINNFKNISAADLTFNAKINCFVGPNGSGKTNLLDAIHYISLTKSYFNIPDHMAIQNGKNNASIKAWISRNQTTEQILISIKPDGKTVKRNNKKYKRLTQHIGLIPIVMITPDDTKLISSSAEERRRFMDIIISQSDSKYLLALNKYKKALQQRNNLLKKFAAEKIFDSELLKIWDIQLISAANYIFNKRLQFCKEFSPLVQKYYELISAGNEKISLQYISQLKNNPFEKLLEQNINKDLNLQYTYAGIHRDDLNFLINNMQLKKFGSQGQQKTFLLALKFAQQDFIKKHLQISPILLLDDIFDKLDPIRVEKLINLVADSHFGQIFTTHTDQHILKNILDKISSPSDIFSVSNGSFKLLKN